MAPTTSWKDCERFAAAIQGAGGRVPDVLQHLVSSYAVLTAPAATRAAEDAIVDAAMAGELTPEKLQKLAPVAAAAANTNAYLADLGRRSENIVLGAWHRALKAEAADAVLDSLRKRFDQATVAIEHAKTLINPESSAEHILASAEPGVIKAWQELDGHLKVVARIVAIASQFGPRNGIFPQITEYALADNFRLDDRAIACTAGDVVTDSGLFQRPDQGHRTSPLFRCGGLKLWTIAEMTERYNLWAADQFDAQHSGPRGGRLIDGVVVRDPIPANPFREKASTR
jgi:hypothetical protein